MKRNLQPVYINPEPDEKSRYGEKEFLIRIVPEFKEDKPGTPTSELKYEARSWNKFLKFMQIEKVR